MSTIYIMHTNVSDRFITKLLT